MDITKQFPSKYLKAADLDGREALVTIKDCIVEDVGDDRRPVLYFVGKEKGVVLNKTNATNIAEAYSPDTDEWLGKKVILFTAYVDFQGKSMESIRIRKPKPHELGAVKPNITQQPQFDDPPPPTGGDPGWTPDGADADIPF